MTKTAITAHAVTIIGMLLTAIHINLDPSLISGAVQGIVALVTLVSSLVAYFSHKNSVPPVAPAA